MKMSWLQLFGLLLFLAHVYGSSQLAATTSYVLLSYVVPVKSKVEISQNFVAFSEYMNFKLHRILKN